MTVIGVIGCGRISGVHFPSLCALDNVRIKYACDLILSKAQAAKDKYKKIDKVTTDYREVLADPEVEAVFVLTPNYAHYTVSMDALRAGKHVFCEKPITVSYALSCEMAEEAKSRTDFSISAFATGITSRSNFSEKRTFAAISATFITFTARSATSARSRVSAVRSRPNRSRAAAYSSTGACTSSTLSTIFSTASSSKRFPATLTTARRRI